MSEHTMAVATLYELSKFGGSYSKEHKREVNAASIVPRRQIDRINDQWEQCGKWYEVDEDETIKRYEAGRVKTAAIKEAEELKDELGSVMAETLKSVKKGRKVKKVVEPVVIDDSTDLLEAARAEYLELTGEEVHHLKGLKGINKLIAEYKEEN